MPRGPGRGLPSRSSVGARIIHATPVGGDDDGVVDDQVVDCGLGGVGLIEGDAARVLEIDEVVLKQRALYAVAVDGGGAGRAVVVDDVPLDERAGDDAGAALADVAV